MATDLEKLVVQLSADIKGYETAMRKAVGVTNRQAREIESRFKQMQTRIDGVGKGIARGIVAPMAGIGAALGTAELIRMTGVWTDLSSRINRASGGMDKGAEVLGRIGEMARRTYSDLEGTANAFLGFSTTLSELGVSTTKQLDFVESLNNALVVSGAKGQVAERVMDALAKAMATGTLQGDNLNTVIEVGGRVAEALAASMGVTTMELRKLGTNGKIGRREMLGLTSQMEKLRAEAKAMPATIQDGFTLLNNALLSYIGRGDEATGVSASIAEALELIADNFETVADNGLKLASVIAGALVGRAMLGMTAAAATGVSSLIAMTKALAAMRVAGLGASLAIGPLGAVLGAVLAGGAILYSQAAKEAEGRTGRVAAELERLGLASKQAAGKIDEAADALDRLAKDDGRLASLREMREELERLKGSAWRSGSLDDITLRANDAQHYQIFRDFGTGGLSEDERAALKRVSDLSQAFKASRVSAALVVDEMQRIDNIELTQPTRALIAELSAAAQSLRGLQTALAAAGEINPFDEQQRVLAEIETQLAQLGSQPFGLAVTGQVREIIASLIEAKSSGEEAQAALKGIADKHPDAAGYIAAISGLLGALREFIAMDAKARGLAANPPSPVSTGRGDAIGQYWADRRKTEAFIAEQTRINGLSKERQDIERRTAAILKEAGAAGAQLTQAQAEQLAAEQAAAEARRSKTGKGGAGKGKTDKSAYADEVTQIREAIAALELEAKALNGAQLSLSGYGDVAEYARKRMELLVAAKKQGLEITPKLSAEIDQLARDYVAAGIAVDGARERHEAFQSALSETRSTMESAFTGLITGAHGFRDALGQVLSRLAEMAASRAFAQLWDGAGGAGSGGGIGKGVGGLLKGLLGFERGGPTPSGPRKQAVGIVHAGENVWSQDDIRRAGGMAAVEAMRRNGGVLPGYANGGIVGGMGAPPAPPSIAAIPRMARGADKELIDIRVGIDQNGNLEAFVDRRSARVAGAMVTQSSQAQRRAMPSSINDIQARGTR